MKGIVIRSMALCVLMLSAARASAALVDNEEYASWAKQKPGAKLVFDTTVNFPGMAMTQEVTHVLKSVTPEKIVVEVTMKMNMGGMTQDQKTTREIPVKIEEAQQGLPPDVKGTIKKTGTGTVKAAGKDYECEIWEFAGDAAGAAATGKFWKTDKLPGLTVQSEMNITTPMGAGVAKTMLKEFTPG